jgi:hypothetical protein
MADLKLGTKVPDFELETYEPTKGEFGKFSMQDQIKNKRWLSSSSIPRISRSSERPNSLLWQSSTIASSKWAATSSR